MSQPDASPTHELVGTDNLDYEQWADALRSGTLLGLECRSCGNATATPKAACIECGSFHLEVIELPPRGTVFSKTTIEVAPEGHGTGYTLALVDVGAARIMARIDAHVEIDDSVELTSPVEHDGAPGPRFDPVD